MQLRDGDVLIAKEGGHYHVYIHPWSAPDESCSDYNQALEAGDERAQRHRAALFYAETAQAAPILLRSYRPD